MGHILSPIFVHLTVFNFFFIQAVAFLLYKIYFELTTGARRRRLIAEKGCEAPYRYPHKGILGRLMGYDVLKEFVRTGREGRMHEALRERNFSNGINTIESRRLMRWSIATIEPENVKSVSVFVLLFCLSLDL
jgi:hypothetical protein